MKNQIDGSLCKTRNRKLTKKKCTSFSRAKCANGFDEMTLEKLQVDLKQNMKKISKNFDLLPKWIEINRELVPDFIVVDPKKSPVWEITVRFRASRKFSSSNLFFFQGAEFSRSKQHTANGISIRFPRLTKFRNDKTWKQATSLSYLNELFEKSKPERKTDEQLDEEEENEENFVSSDMSLFCTERQKSLSVFIAKSFISTIESVCHGKIFERNSTLVEFRISYYFY